MSNIIIHQLSQVPYNYLEYFSTIPPKFHFVINMYLCAIKIQKIYRKNRPKNKKINIFDRVLCITKSGKFKYGTIIQISPNSLVSPRYKIRSLPLISDIFNNRYKSALNSIKNSKLNNDCIILLCK